MFVFFDLQLLTLALIISFGKFLTIAIFTLLTKVNNISEKKIYKLNLRKDQTILELKASWHLIIDGIILIVFTKLNFYCFAPVTFTNVMFGFLIFLIWAEITFYWAHRAMHENKFLWKLHVYHHRSIVVQPLTAASFSLGEHMLAYTLLWQGGIALFSHFVPISAYSILAFYVFYFFTSPIAHSNVELVPNFMRKSFFSQYIGSGTTHAIHHARFTQNYGFVTTLFDRLHNTYADDTEILRDKAFNGNGFVSVSQKIE